MLARLLSGSTAASPAPTPPVSSQRPARPPHSRLTIRATSDALLLTAATGSSARLGYDGTIGLATGSLDAEGASCECGAVIGLLKLFAGSYLLVIGASESVAVLPSSAKESRTIRRVANVFAIPLSDQQSASMVIHAHARRNTTVQDSELTDSEAEAPDADEDEITPPTSSRSDDQTDPAATVKRNTGLLGLSGAAFSLWRPARVKPKPATPGEGPEHHPPVPRATTVEQAAAEAVPVDLTDAASRRRLDAKVLRQTLIELRSGIYYAVDTDITRRTQPGQDGHLLAERDTHKPLLERVDPRFVYNAHLLQPLVRAGLIAFALPVMQGFVQQATVLLPLTLSETKTPVVSDGERSLIDVELTIISRRSVERPGLRFQRRGVDVDGHVANFVETEMIVDCTPDKLQHVASYVQTRGSVPLFWRQSPWSLKPPPELERTDEENKAAIAKHFEAMCREYSSVDIVNVAEQHGREGALVKAYGDRVEALGRPDVQYHAWDMHAECRGMKYENIQRLIDLLESEIHKIDVLWATEEQVFSTQRGVIRTNCVDCLDRTNVIQSALARNVLSTVLSRFGIAHEAPGSRDELELAFNNLWASNGDAISRLYAGTSALKGDFVRTGKRDWRGMLNDARNSISRLYGNAVNDFFKQATIDYITGINLGAFSEFQATLVASDPGELLRLSQIRATAIETSANDVLADEVKLDGWTLLSPTEHDQIVAAAYEEKVVLLTRQALYVCSYEYGLQKVRDFIRIPLAEINGLTYGPYVISTLSSFARDTTSNQGFIVRYNNSSATSGRSRQYSIKNTVETNDETVTETFIAFKIMRKDLVKGAAPVAQTTAQEDVQQLVSKLKQAIEDVGHDAVVTAAPVHSLEDALKRTTLYERLLNTGKHLIWL